MSIELIQAGEFLGMAEGVPSELYHSSPGLGSSGLKDFATCAAFFRANKVTPIEETNDMRIGTLTHMGLLESERFKTDTVLIEGSANG